MKSESLQDAAGYSGAPKQVLRGKELTSAITSRREAILLAVWFAANLVVGALTVHQYGVSFDEPNNYRYAADTLAAYKTWFGLLGPISYNASYDGHGPAFMTAVLLLIRGIQGILPGVFQPDLFHFSYFIAFQLTGLCLYLLMRRWFHTWTAWAVLILFDTQPLLLGHAFINPKDIPFMLFFTLSILLGFRMADGVSPDGQFISLASPFSALNDKLKESSPSRRRRFFLLLGLALATALALAVFSGPINLWVEQAAKYLYRAAPNSLAGQVFALLATHAGGPTLKDFVAATQLRFQRVEGIALLAGLLLFLVYFCLSFPAVLRSAWEQRRRLASLSRLPGASRGWFQLALWKAGILGVLRGFRQPRVMLAALVLGVATSVRAVAPWAGLLAFLFLLIKVRSKAWATGVAYFLVAGVVTYLTWPRLWGAPLERYWAGIHTISNFVAAQHVRFNGRLYPATGLPGSYLFTLLNIQLTEPFLVCAYIGMALVVWQLLRSRVRSDLLLYVLLGFAAPVLGWQVMRSPLYDNLRQVLFLFPALFMLAAITLEWLFSKVSAQWLRVILIAAMALPGLYSSVRLYPYEYNYFNSVVGGVAGARKLYVMDPWRTSLRELTLALNQQAPTGGKVLAGQWMEIMSLYARPDLVLEASYSSTADANGEYDYAVEVPNVKPWDLQHETQDAYAVTSGGAVLGTLLGVNNAVAK